MKMHTPCDERDELTGEYYCPYMDSSGYVDCEYWCHDESDYDYVPEDEDDYI